MRWFSFGISISFHSVCAGLVGLSCLLCSVWVKAEKPAPAGPTPQVRVLPNLVPKPTTHTTKAKANSPEQNKAAEVRVQRAKPTAQSHRATGSPLSVPVERVRRYPGMVGTTVLENRDAQTHTWNLTCDQDTISGQIRGDSIIHFRHRGGVSKPCQLALSGQNTSVGVGTGDKLIIRQGRLFALQVTTVVYPPIPTVGDLDLAKNPHLHRQWALLAKASSEYTNTSWSAMQAAGPANVMVCSDSVNAWATKAADHGMEWLSLLYKQKVRAVGVVVYLNLNPGAIVKVEAQTGAGWVTVWEGKDVSKGICPSKLALRFNEPVDTQAIRLVLDTRLVSGWNEVDAVELISSP